MQRNDQLRNQITQSLQDIKSALLDHPGTKLKRLLSKDMDDTFDASQRVVLEIFLSHQHSPLFVSSTAEICHKLLDDLRCCLGLSLDETIEALLQVGMKAISHTGASWGRWATLMYIRIPQMLRLMAAPSLLQARGLTFLSLIQFKTGLSKRLINVCRCNLNLPKLNFSVKDKPLQKLCKNKSSKCRSHTSGVGPLFASE